MSLNVNNRKTHQCQQLLRRSGANKTGNVNVDECRHQELTVETIHNSTVSGNHITEILRKKL
jgi:hypothetical protein